jgi:hypothetical protein
MAIDLGGGGWESRSRCEISEAIKIGTEIKGPLER